MLKVIVISQIDAVARRENIVRQFEGRAADYQFLNAMHADDGLTGLLDGVDEKQFLLETGRLVTPGEIGCYASHLAAWHICVVAKAPLVILEDDVELTDDFDEAIRLCAGLIDRCGFIRLQSEQRGRSRSVFRVNERFELRVYRKMPHSSAGYVISPRVARDLSRLGKVMRSPIDVFLKQFWVHRQIMYGLIPYSIREWPTDSTIGARSKAPRTISERVARQANKLRGYFRRLHEAGRQSYALRHPSIRPGVTTSRRRKKHFLSRFDPSLRG